jgi:hypothetical protein
MKKHVTSYFDLNETVGRGSILFVNGVGLEPKLYATHVLSSASIRGNAKMLFLSNEFYRIVSKDGRLHPIRVNFRNDESLMGALNLKVPGRISIVTNHNKTPYHWKTLKHSSIYSALREIDQELQFENYSFD